MTIREGGWRNVEAWSSADATEVDWQRVSKFGLLLSTLHPYGREDVFSLYYDSPSILARVFQALVLKEEKVDAEILGIYTDAVHCFTLVCYAAHAHFPHMGPTWNTIEINYLDVSYEDIVVVLQEAVQDEAAAQEGVSMGIALQRFQVDEALTNA